VVLLKLLAVTGTAEGIEEEDGRFKSLADNER